MKLKIVIMILVLSPAVLLGAHELSVRHFQATTCVVCHEMREPIRKWTESGTAKNHNNCAACHYDAGIQGWMAMNRSAYLQLIEHFQRDPDESLKPPEEPLFLDEDQEPGYWSLVPNSRCYSCKNVENHREIDQHRIHSKLLKDISNQPCKDCHNHEMRKGQKFYEKLIIEEG